MRGVGTTAKGYFPRLLRWWWIVAVSFLLQAIAAVLLFVSWEQVTMLSIWAFVAMFLIGLAIAQFIVFHQIRVERDLIREERDKLQDFKNYEDWLDRLSEFFDHGNNEILNKPIPDEVSFGVWTAEWERWSEEIQDFLEKNFGLRERNLFKNAVLFDYIPFKDHARERSIVARQLEMLRDTIVRYSDRVQRWRAENT